MVKHSSSYFLYATILDLEHCIPSLLFKPAQKAFYSFNHVLNNRSAFFQSVTAAL